MDFRSRMQTLTRLRHPNVVNTIGCCLDNGSQSLPLMVQEYADNKSLHDVLHNTTIGFGPDSLMSMLSNIVDGMVFLHSHDPLIIHGHLSSYNILVDSNFRCKIADWLGSCSPVLMVKDGSPWLAPEASSGPVTEASDVYSFSVIARECFSRNDPHHVQTVFDDMDDDLDTSDETPFDPLSASANSRLWKRHNSLYVPMPEPIENIVKSCGSLTPARRPDFLDLRHQIKKMRFRTLGDEFVQRGVEGDRQNKVLQQVFPSHIVEALKRGDRPESEEKSNVAVLFADIVGFTRISSTLTASQVAEMLDRLYCKMDMIISELGLYKLEVIGDCIIVVANLFGDNEDKHVSDLSRFALRALQAAAETPILSGSDMGSVNIRCGIHVGPVTAMVLGKLSPKYSLFGNTVNMASRMESSCIPMYTQLSEDAARILRCSDAKLATQLVPRGQVDIKGKGLVKTYWLLQPNQSIPTGDKAVVIVHPNVIAQAKPRRDSVAVYVSEPEEITASSVERVKPSKSLLSRLKLRHETPAQMVFQALRDEQNESSRRGSSHHTMVVGPCSSSDDRIASAPPGQGSPTRQQQQRRRRRKSHRSDRVSPRAATVATDKHQYEVYSIPVPGNQTSSNNTSAEASPFSPGRRPRVSWAPLEPQSSHESRPIAKINNRESIDTMPRGSDTALDGLFQLEADDSSTFASPQYSPNPSRSASTRASFASLTRTGSSRSVRGRQMFPETSSRQGSSLSLRSVSHEQLGSPGPRASVVRTSMSHPHLFYPDMIPEVSEPSTANHSERSSYQYNPESPTEARLSFRPQLSYIDESEQADNGAKSPSQLSFTDI
eukprot:TRINITY_DN11046_c0_g1_i1.p1 TRINITY_DN11046_c0_g1~~TRINITY_DN11046_c0_g1_i1.p1  ORF type:complete len:924 (+),score=181.28 TRINITY_DN11046_c0_g1_i1:281-2773(+)